MSNAYVNHLVIQLFKSWVEEDKSAEELFALLNIKGDGCDALEGPNLDIDLAFMLLDALKSPSTKEFAEEILDHLFSHWIKRYPTVERALS